MSSDESAVPDLLYPFYLDVDMSMAFAAVLTGGVALEEHESTKTDSGSEAVKNLRGNLKLLATFGLGGASGSVSAERSKSENQGFSTSSDLTRHHTVASIFIDLYDELRRTGRMAIEPEGVSDFEIGQLVSLRVGPATAPLRRVVDQVVRLLELMLPTVGIAMPPEPAASGNRPKARQGQNARGKSAEDDDSEPVRMLYRLFVALRDDLDRSGMIDVVVRRLEGPDVVLTLDKRFTGAPTLELLHTSASTVVGKVTRLWPSAEDYVNLHRQSVTSLVPALQQATVWGVLTLLAMFARGIDVASVQRSAMEAAGEPPSAPVGDAEPDPLAVEDPAAPSDEIVFGDDALAALTPTIQGPAIQILPLAICS